MNEKTIRDKLAYYSNLTYKRGLVTAAGGNISYRFGKNKYLVSPTNCCLGNIKPDEFVMIDSNFKLINGHTAPSKETKMHMEIYSLKKDINCVLHTHSPYATAFSINNSKIPMVTASARLKLVDTPLVTYADPGTEELSQLVYNKVRSTDNPMISCFLMKDHGVLCFSTSIEDAFNLAELCEDTAKIAYLSKDFIKGLNNKNVYDLSQTLFDRMPKYPLDPDVTLKVYRTFKKDGFNLLKIETGLHAGTHIDAPCHQLAGGEGIDKFSLNRFMGKAIVFDVLKNSNCPIEISDIDTKQVKKDLIIFFHTGWEKYVGIKDYYNNPPYISEELARLLVEKKVKAIGVDMPSIDSFTGKEPVSHRLLLKNDIPIIEGLINLKILINKEILFIGFPIKIENGDGSPIRAIALEI